MRYLIKASSFLAVGAIVIGASVSHAGEFDGGDSTKRGADATSKATLASAGVVLRSEKDAFRDHVGRLTGKLDGRTISTPKRDIPPDQADQDPGPSFADFDGSIEDGRLLLDSVGSRITAITSKRGDACFQFARSGATQFITCAASFDAIGVILVVGPDEVIGLAEDSVTRVAVRGANGRVTDAVMTNNAFVWQSTTKPVELIVSHGDRILTKYVG